MFCCIAFNCIMMIVLVPIVLLMLLTLMAIGHKITQGDQDQDKNFMSLSLEGEYELVAEVFPISGLPPSKA